LATQPSSGNQNTLWCRTFSTQLTTLKISQAGLTPLLDSSLLQATQFASSRNEMWNMKSFMCCVKLLTQKANVCDPRGHGDHEIRYDVWFRVHKTNALLRVPFYVRFLSRFMRNIHDARNMFGFLWKNVTATPATEAPLKSRRAQT